MEFITECGVFGYLDLLAAIAGLVTAATWGRKIGKPGGVATVFAVALMALGGVGFGAGMRMVEKAVAAAEAAKRVDLVTIGSREASGNLLLAGLCALAVLAVGGVLTLMQKPKA